MSAPAVSVIAASLSPEAPLAPVRMTFESALPLMAGSSM